MNFAEKEFLEQHILTTMNFYHPHCIDSDAGGFYHYFLDDGTVYNENHRHLVSSARFVFNYATAAVYFQNDEFRDVAQHGLNFIRQVHWQPSTQGFAWTIQDKKAADKTNHCYGLAFVLLAGATGVKAEINNSLEILELAFNTMETHFWSEADGLYADEANEDWSAVSSYRGQNANMHSCEALIAGFEATGDKKYLERALLIADNICNRQAKLGNGLIWEHYDQNWQVDWEYNKADPKHLFKPWRFQPGHQTEWAKLLLILSRYDASPWLVEKAQYLFDESLDLAWDSEHQGIFYGLAPDGNICDDDKYFWVQAETFAAAAALAVKTRNPEYWDWYEKIWDYSWQYLVDHQHGAWFRILTRDNNKYDNRKSPAGKTDYHTLGACYEVLRWLKEDHEQP